MAQRPTKRPCPGSGQGPPEAKVSRVPPNIEKAIEPKRYIENDLLKRYHDKIVPQKDRKAMKAAFHDDLDKIFSFVNKKDDRFSLSSIKGVGSRFSGLAIGNRSDYDYSYCLNFILNEDSGFGGGEDDDNDVDDQDESDSTESQKKPEYGYCRQPISDAKLIDVFQRSPSLMEDRYLSPALVKGRLRELVREAIRNLKFNGNFSTSPDFHGPALTLHYKADPKKFGCGGFDIDLSAAIRCRKTLNELKFNWPPKGQRQVQRVSAPWAYSAANLVPQPDYQHQPNFVLPRQQPFTFPSIWTPQPSCSQPQSRSLPSAEPKWPPAAKVEEIRNTGFLMVAKKDAFWRRSAAELEKILLRQMGSSRDNCRKMVFRILKSFHQKLWDLSENPEISSYILKNVWMLEMEANPLDSQWTHDKLNVRVFGCIKSLLDYVYAHLKGDKSKGPLRLYFDREDNLLDDKDNDKLAVEYVKIKQFYDKPRLP